jgi:hypothetical protein
VKRYQISLLVFGTIGLVALAEGWRTGIGKPSLPGSGAWLLVLGSIILLSSLALWREQSTNASPGKTGLFYITAAVLVFEFAYPRAGVMIAAILSAALSTRVFPGPGERWVIGTAALIALGIWLVLTYKFQIYLRLLPVGMGV